MPLSLVSKEHYLLKHYPAFLSGVFLFKLIQINIMQDKLRTETELLLQRLDAFFTACDKLPTDSYEWRTEGVEAVEYDEAFKALRQQYISTMQVRPS